MTGFELLESLDRIEPPVVIFVTAHDEFALRAFDVHALDYLLKLSTTSASIRLSIALARI